MIGVEVDVEVDELPAAIEFPEPLNAIYFGLGGAL